MAIEKEFKVRFSKVVPNAYEVYVDGGGEVPQMLSGTYTDPRVANVAISQYLNTRRNRSGRVKADAV